MPFSFSAVGSGTPTTSGGVTKVTASVTPVTSGTTANATITESTLNSAINSAITEAARQGAASVVEVNVGAAVNADTLNVNLPVASLKTLAAAENASLVILSDIAEVALDNAALDALAGQATGGTVTLEVTPVVETALTAAQKDAAGQFGASVMDISLVSGGTTIHDYKGGKITVSLPFTLKADLRAEDIVVFYLDGSGKLEACETSYANGWVTFVTNRL